MGDVFAARALVEVQLGDRLLGEIEGGVEAPRRQGQRGGAVLQSGGAQGHPAFDDCGRAEARGGAGRGGPPRFGGGWVRRKAEPQAGTPFSSRAGRTGAGAWSQALGLGDRLALRGSASSFSFSAWAAEAPGLRCGQAPGRPPGHAGGHSAALPWSGSRDQSTLETLGAEKEVLRGDQGLGRRNECF